MATAELQQPAGIGTGQMVVCPGLALQPRGPTAALSGGLRRHRAGAFPNGLAQASQ